MQNDNYDHKMQTEMDYRSNHFYELLFGYQSNKNLCRWSHENVLMINIQSTAARLKIIYQPTKVYSLKPTFVERSPASMFLNQSTGQEKTNKIQQFAMDNTSVIKDKKELRNFVTTLKNHPTSTLYNGKQTHAMKRLNGRLRK